MNNYFELFDLTANFNINKKELTQKYQQLISQYHPDRFTRKSESEKTKALHNSTIINDAYQTLNSDLKRTNYLLELAGINAFDEKDTQMDTGFLMQQIEFAASLEQLQQKQDMDNMESFIDKMTVLEQQHIADISRYFEEQNLEKVKQLVRELKFYQQLKQQANQSIDELL